LTEGLLHIPHEIVRIPNPRIKVKDFLEVKDSETPIFVATWKNQSLKGGKGK
jgi:hypothetical protein